MLYIYVRKYESGGLVFFPFVYTRLLIIFGMFGLVTGMSWAAAPRQMLCCAWVLHAWPCCVALQAECAAPRHVITPP